jgi:hypothetical protein
VSTEQNNPLRKYFRQPKLYLKLPSNGQFYPPGALDMPENGELPVYPMTAKDELLMKTPDALINGQSTVEVIKSCIPSIIDPWKMPSIDLDAVLISIRLASYGEKLEIKKVVPNTTIEKDFTVDLRDVMKDVVNFTFDQYLEIDESITIQLKPITYREFTENNLKTFEEQRIFKVLNDNTIDETQKLTVFSAAFKKLTNLTFDLVLASISAIDTPEGKVTNKAFIKDFFNNADKSYFEKVLKHLEKVKELSSVKPFIVHSTPEDIEAGAPEQYEIPITFDQANFFA